MTTKCFQLTSALAAEQLYYTVLESLKGQLRDLFLVLGADRRRQQTVLRVHQTSLVGYIQTLEMTSQRLQQVKNHSRLCVHALPTTECMSV